MVTVGILARLEAKPGKEQAVEDFLRMRFRSLRPSRPPAPGMRSSSGPRRSASLTRSRMPRGGKLISKVLSRKP